MVELSAFVSRVAPNVMAAPTPVVEQAILDACIEFCEKSSILRQTLDQITVGAQSYEIDLDAPLMTKIVQVKRVWWGTTELDPVSEDTSNVYAFTQSITGQSIVLGTPRQFTEVSSSIISLYPRPDVSGYLTVRAALKPSRTATKVDDVLLEDWAEAIATGALSRLYKMRADWADPLAAKIKDAEFRNHIGNAILESTRGRNRAEDVVTPVHI